MCCRVDFVNRYESYHVKTNNVAFFSLHDFVLLYKPPIYEKTLDLNHMKVPIFDLPKERLRKF